VKYLETFAEEDESTLNEAKEEAVRAVIEFVKSPDMFQVELECWNSESTLFVLHVQSHCILYQVLAFNAPVCESTCELFV